MKKSALLIALLLSALAGCQSMPHPGPGLSAVQVKVIAEAKAGVVGPRVSTYDQSSGTGYGDFERVDYSDLHDIVVWLEPADAKSAAGPSVCSVGINLNGRGSSDLAGVAGVGQKIVFRNTSSVPITAYCVSDGNNFNLGTIAPGGVAETVVRSAGLIEIISDALADPIARIYAAPTPWVSLTHSGASVDFNDIPPGHYRIASWHPRLPGSTSEVNLLPDQAVRGSITVGVNPLPKIDSK